MYNVKLIVLNGSFLKISQVLNSLSQHKQSVFHGNLFHSFISALGPNWDNIGEK